MALLVTRTSNSGLRTLDYQVHTAHHRVAVHRIGSTNLAYTADNADGVSASLSFTYYLRMRFLHALLPQLLAAPSARVLSIHFAGREGRLIEDDLLLQRSYSFPLAGMHTATMTSLALEAVAAAHPTISCVHAYPGLVVTEGKKVFTSDWPWVLSALWHRVLTPLMRLWAVSLEESGARNLFLATSGRYPAREMGRGLAAGVELGEGVSVARGSDWEVGSGCYLLNWDGEEVGDRKLLQEYRDRGMGEKIWEHTRRYSGV